MIRNIPASHCGLCVSVASPWEISWKFDDLLVGSLADHVIVGQHIVCTVPQKYAVRIHHDAVTGAVSDWYLVLLNCVVTVDHHTA